MSLYATPRPSWIVNWLHTVRCAVCVAQTVNVATLLVLLERPGFDRTDQDATHYYWAN